MREKAVTVEMAGGAVKSCEDSLYFSPLVLWRDN